jgi:uncharacterized Tic20 family protein
MVRPVGHSSAAADTFVPSETWDRDSKSFKVATKAIAIAVCILVAGPVKAWETTKMLFQHKGVQFQFSLCSSILAGSAVIITLAMLASATALPVISLIGSVIAGLTFSVGAFSLAVIVAIPMAIAIVSICEGAGLASKTAFEIYKN